MDDLKKMLYDQRLYYVIAPAVAALWPLYAGLIALNKSNEYWSTQISSTEKGQDYITQILRLDPERLSTKRGSSDFSYPSVVNRVASSVSISPANCVLQVKAVVKAKGGQESQDADVTIKQVDMITFARFLSAMQLEGANIQCNSVSLTKQKGSADLWTAQMTFKYYRK